MLPQHGGVPNFRMRLSGPVILLLALVLLTGLMLTLSSHLNTDPGDMAAQTRTRLTLMVTLLLSALILLAGTNRWWHRHLWKHGNSQRQHRHRVRHSRSGHSHRSR